MDPINETPEEVTTTTRVWIRGPDNTMIPDPSDTSKQMPRITITDIGDGREHVLTEYEAGERSEAPPEEDPKLKETIMAMIKGPPKAPREKPGKEHFKVYEDLCNVQPDIVASSVLKQNNIANCIVGEVADFAYGLKPTGKCDEIHSVHIVVAKSNVEKAHEVLLANGFIDHTTDKAFAKRKERRYRSFSKKVGWTGSDGVVTIHEASKWRLKGCLKDFENGTVVYDKNGVRFPRIDLYISGLIDILTEDRKMPHGKTLEDLNYNLACLVEAQYPELQEKLSDCDQFFIGYYYKMPVEGIGCVVHMREKIMDGEKSIKHAWGFLMDNYPKLRTGGYPKDPELTQHDYHMLTEDEQLYRKAVGSMMPKDITALEDDFGFKVVFSPTKWDTQFSKIY